MGTTELLGDTYRGSITSVNPGSVTQPESFTVNATVSRDERAKGTHEVFIKGPGASGTTEKLAVTYVDFWDSSSYDLSFNISSSNVEPPFWLRDTFDANLDIGISYAGSTGTLDSSSVTVTRDPNDGSPSLSLGTGLTYDQDVLCAGARVKGSIGISNNGEQSGEAGYRVETADGQLIKRTTQPRTVPAEDHIVEEFRFDVPQESKDITTSLVQDGNVIDSIDGRIEVDQGVAESAGISGPDTLCPGVSLADKVEQAVSVQTGSCPAKVRVKFEGARGETDITDPKTIDPGSQQNFVVGGLQMPDTDFNMTSKIQVESGSNWETINSDNLSIRLSPVEVSIGNISVSDSVCEGQQLNNLPSVEVTNESDCSARIRTRWEINGSETTAGPTEVDSGSTVQYTVEDVTAGRNNINLSVTTEYESGEGEWTPIGDTKTTEVEVNRVEARFDSLDSPSQLCKDTPLEIQANATLTGECASRLRAVFEDITNGGVSTSDPVDVEPGDTVGFVYSEVMGPEQLTVKAGIQVESEDGWINIGETETANIELLEPRVVLDNVDFPNPVKPGNAFTVDFNLSNKGDCAAPVTVGFDGQSKSETLEPGSNVSLSYNLDMPPKESVILSYEVTNTDEGNTIADSKLSVNPKEALFLDFNDGAEINIYGGFNSVERYDGLLVGEQLKTEGTESEDEFEGKGFYKANGELSSGYDVDGARIQSLKYFKLRFSKPVVFIKDNAIQGESDVIEYNGSNLASSRYTKGGPEPGVSVSSKNSLSEVINTRGARLVLVDALRDGPVEF